MPKEERSLEEYLAEQDTLPEKPFRPCAIYNEALDNLEVYLSPEKAILEWVDDKMGVMLLAKDRKKVGGLVLHGWAEHFARSPIGELLSRSVAHEVPLVLICSLILSGVEVTKARGGRFIFKAARPTEQERLLDVMNELPTAKILVDKSLELAGA